MFRAHPRIAPSARFSASLMSLTFPHPALAWREPDLLIDPAGRRRPASPEQFSSLLILSAGSPASGQACAQGSPILTPIISALRI
jgi:hypothetical protein